MSQNPLPWTSATDTWHDRMACRLANFALRLASREYRAFVRGSIEYGLRAAKPAAEDSP